MTRPRVALLDYGSGNLRSAERALERVGAAVEVVSAAADGAGCAGFVVPGVGAFAACMAGIRASGADVVVRDRVAAGRPVLGICVGLQVLYEEGDEHGEVTTGIGVRRGRVARLDAPVLPHMGWNTVEGAATSTLFDGVVGERFYFVHSYGVTTPAAGDVTSTHGASRFVAAVDDGALAATQFHPEKSGDAGLRLLENWVRRLG